MVRDQGLVKCGEIFILPILFILGFFCCKLAVVIRTQCILDRIDVVILF